MTGAPGWRNWKTRQTQNLVLRKQRGGSTPPPGTKKFDTCRQPEPAGWQPHGSDCVERGDGAEAAGGAARVGPQGDRHCPARQPDQSPNPIVAETQSRDLQAAARPLELELHILHASTDRDFDTVFATLVQLRAGGLVIGGEAFFTNRSGPLAAQGRETGRPAGPAVHESRADHQPRDREGARPHDPALGAGAGG
jgi:hypothetical protein